MMTPIIAPTIPYTSASELSSSENKNVNKLIYQPAQLLYIDDVCNNIDF